MLFFRGDFTMNDNLCLLLIPLALAIALAECRRRGWA